MPEKEKRGPMKKKKWKKWAAGIVIVLLVVLIAVGNYLVSFAVGRKKGVNVDVVPASSVSQETQDTVSANQAIVRQQREEWLSDITQEAVQITSDDGLTLRGDVFLNQTDSHLWLLAVHGYTGKRADMYGIASYYGTRGYHVLTPDMRGHGQSEGTYIGMGWLDRRDVLRWIDYIIQRDAEAQIILHGVSMGGATVMMVSGEELSPHVKGIVEDCGYTSVWDIFSDELSYLFHLPDFPVLYAASMMCKIRAGYSFGEASALKQVAKSQTPILFIHGSEDNFVHTEMVYKLYEACNSQKELLVVDGAGHGQSYVKDPELYFQTVFDFIQENCLS